MCGIKTMHSTMQSSASFILPCAFAVAQPLLCTTMSALQLAASLPVCCGLQVREWIDVNIPSDFVDAGRGAEQGEGECAGEGKGEDGEVYGAAGAIQEAPTGKAPPWIEEEEVDMSKVAAASRLAAAYDADHGMCLSTPIIYVHKCLLYMYLCVQTLVMNRTAATESATRCA